MSAAKTIILSGKRTFERPVLPAQRLAGRDVRSRPSDLLSPSPSIAPAAAPLSPFTPSPPLHLWEHPGFRMRCILHPGLLMFSCAATFGGDPYRGQGGGARKADVSPVPPVPCGSSFTPFPLSTLTPLLPSTDCPYLCAPKRSPPWQPRPIPKATPSFRPQPTSRWLTLRPSTWRCRTR